MTSLPPVARFRRVVGRYATGRPGPTVLVCAGLHGNEPAGVFAAGNVLRALQAEGAPLRGELVAVAGNLPALEAGRRHLARDLNRCWTDAEVAALREADPATDDPEQREQRALLAILDDLEARADGGRLVVLDLHTTSGDSPPFSLMSDTLRNRSIAFALPLPVILGLEEAVDGTLLEYLTERGHRVVVVESGRHDEERARDLHEAVIRVALDAAGALPDDGTAVARLAEASRGLPRVVEVRHRHPVADATRFAMEPGWRGFRPVVRGTLLARDHGREVRAPVSGRIVMPLYQRQGSDGFFLVRPVRRFWLLVSAVVRRLRLHVLLPLLPGVRRHPDRPHTLRVDPRVARWLVVEVFHLFGFRRRRREGDLLVFSRRRPG